jgi:hypothetical protein
MIAWQMVRRRCCLRLLEPADEIVSQFLRRFGAELVMSIDFQSSDNIDWELRGAETESLSVLVVMYNYVYPRCVLDLSRCRQTLSMVPPCHFNNLLMILFPLFRLTINRLRKTVKDG